MKRISLILSVLIIIFSSCEKSITPSVTETVQEMELGTYSLVVDDESINHVGAPFNQSQNKKSAHDKSTKLIKDGSLTIVSQAISKSKSAIDNLVTSHRAYYEQDNYHASDYRLAYNLNIRIPSDQFEPFIDALEKGDHQLTSKNISTRDVTEEYIDLEIRLDNNLAYLKRYNQLLAKANSVKDMLEIQEKTRQISAEIESIKGRLKYLDNKVGYSTLSIQLEQHLSPIHRPAQRNFSNQIINALKGGFHSMLDFVLWTASIWPMMLGLLILYLFRQKLWSLLRRDRSNKS